MPSHKGLWSEQHKGWSYPTLDFVVLAHDTAIEDYGGLAGVKDQGLLESAITGIFFAVDGAYQYPSHFDKVAALGFSIARNHAFNDGNKRTALAVVTQTLEWNREYLEWSEETETLIFRLLGFGGITRQGFKYALLDACGHDAKDAYIFDNT